MAEIRIPDIGDVENVEVIEICAAIGDLVTSDDALIVIESDKASMEVPAGVAGIVEGIEVGVGDEVVEGDLIARIAVASEASATADDSPEELHEAAPTAAEAAPTAVNAASEAAEATSEAAEAASEAADTFEVRVPDIGDANDVVVIEVAVKAGDTVAPDDLLVVVESDKASMEIPAGQAGEIRQLHVEAGSEVVEGTLLATLAISGSVTPRAAGESKPAGPAAAPRHAQRALEPVGEKPRGAAVDDAGSTATSARPGAAGARFYAGPAVRRLARELGVDLSQVAGSGNRDRIVKADVKSFVKTAMHREQRTEGSGIPAVPTVDFAKFGEIQMLPMTRIRIAGAVNLHRSWLNIPHVTQHEEADITELEDFRKTLKEEAARRDLKITPLAFIIKACCYALKAFPTFNASLDADVRNFILKKYYHIGFAVDTPDGLVVPVIRDADKLGIWELCAAIAEQAEKAREQKLGLNDMRGGTFSISSLGGIGGTGFTPVINAPEVAILGVSRLVMKPVWSGTDFQPRKVLPLSLSYDHRAINGAEAGRFLAALTELLGEIRRLSL